jgi:predicted secreted protein
MDGFLGRDIVLQWGGNSPGDIILGIREKGIECNGEAIDVTSDENDGWRVVLTEAGQNEVTISLSGVSKDDRIQRAWFSGQRTQPVFLTYPDGRIVSGTFFLQSFTDTGPYNDATTFEAELISTGPVTYSPATS